VLSALVKENVMVVLRLVRGDKNIIFLNTVLLLTVIMFLARKLLGGDGRSLGKLGASKNYFRSSALISGYSAGQNGEKASEFLV
jgi:hypothetical protein